MLPLIIALFLSFLPAAGHSMSTDSRLNAEAVVMVQDAVTLFGQRGQRALLAQVSDPTNETFHKRGLFVLVWQKDGTLIGHGLGSKFLGQNLIGVTDAKGMPFIRRSIETAVAGGGWITYTSWDDPVSQDMSEWAMYVQPAGDLVIGVGVGPGP